MARIKTETNTHHVMRVEMKDFRRLLEVPEGVRVFNVAGVRYEGGPHIDIYLSGTLPEVEAPARKTPKRWWQK